MEKYCGYHGTNKKNKDSIQNQLNIPNSNLLGNRRKKPGNFGYGFYMFLEDFEMARLFSLKFLNLDKEEDIAILEIHCEIEEDEVLDFRDFEITQYLNVYFQKNIKSIENHLKNLSIRNNYEREIVATGIAIELFILELKSRQKKVGMTIGYSNTSPKGNPVKMTLPNAVEVCIRDKKYVTNIIEKQ